MYTIFVQGAGSQSVAMNIRARAANRQKTDLTPINEPKALARGTGLRPMHVPLSTNIKGRVAFGKGFTHHMSIKHSFEKLTGSIDKQLRRDIEAYTKAGVHKVHTTIYYNNELLFVGVLTTLTALQKIRGLYLANKHLNIY